MINKQTEAEEKLINLLLSHIVITSKFGLKTEGGNLVMKNGQWVPENDTKVTGQIVLDVKYDGEPKIFPANITGTKITDDKTTFQCGNGESFYLVGQKAYPTKDKTGKIDSEILEELISEYKKNKTEKLAWEIWRIKNLQ